MSISFTFWISFSSFKMIVNPSERSSFIDFVRSAPAFTVVIGLTSFLLIFILSDYISLIIVRRYLSVGVANFISSLIISFFIGVTVVFLATMIFITFSYELIFLHQMGVGALFSREIFVRLYSGVIGNFTVYFEHPETFLWNVGPAFLIHFWMVLFAVGALLTRLLYAIFFAITWAQWLLKQGDRHPLRAIGVVAASLVFIISAFSKLL
jgi:hypothetical protein